MATRKFKITYVAPVCGSHYISFGQHRFRYPEVLTQPMGLRKGFLEEGTPKLSWNKGKVMRGGSSRQESLRASGLGSRGQQGLGGLSCSPRQPRAGPASGGSYQSQTFQSSVTNRPGKFCLTKLFSLMLGTLWEALQGSCVWVWGAGRVDRWQHSPGRNLSPPAAPTTSPSVSSRKALESLQSPGSFQP